MQCGSRVQRRRAGHKRPTTRVCYHLYQRLAGLSERAAIATRRRCERTGAGLGEHGPEAGMHSTCRDEDLECRGQIRLSLAFRCPIAHRRVASRTLAPQPSAEHTLPLQ